MSVYEQITKLKEVLNNTSLDDISIVVEDKIELKKLTARSEMFLAGLSDLRYARNFLMEEFGEYDFDEDNLTQKDSNDMYFLVMGFVNGIDNIYNLKFASNDFSLALTKSDYKEHKKRLATIIKGFEEIQDNIEFEKLLVVFKEIIKVRNKINETFHFTKEWNENIKPEMDKLKQRLGNKKEISDLLDFYDPERFSIKQEFIIKDRNKMIKEYGLGLAGFEKN